MVYNLRFFLFKCSLFHNSNIFGSCIVHISYTGCAKIKTNNSGAKRLTCTAAGVWPESRLETNSLCWRQITFQSYRFQCSSWHKQLCFLLLLPCLESVQTVVLCRFWLQLVVTDDGDICPLLCTFLLGSVHFFEPSFTLDLTVFTKNEMFSRNKTYT